MDYIKKNDNVIFYQKDLNLGETLDCGQAFRWEMISDNTYRGFSHYHSLVIIQNNDEFTLVKTTEEDFSNVWHDYFDLSTDYSKLKIKFSDDDILNKACHYAPGIRLLRQNKWEALCSFIISQNNNIPRIKGIIERLCGNFGTNHDFSYTFPSAKTLAVLSVDDLSPLRAGFRARYILDAAKKVADGEIDLDEVSKLSLEEARAKLMTIVGVGVKVADCALLYGMHRLEFFPVDVWIKRVIEKYYPDGLPECIKGYEGIAQQYLFHYIRNLNDKE